MNYVSQYPVLGAIVALLFVGFIALAVHKKKKLDKDQ